MSTDARALPWRLVDVLVLWVLLAVGALALVLSWWGVSATTRLSRQVAWLDLGVLGVLIAEGGVALWLCVGRRAVGKRRRLLLPDLSPTAESVTLRAAGGPGEWVAADNMTRYHTPECAFVIGKAVRAAPTISHRRAGRRPCGVCRPDREGRAG